MVPDFVARTRRQQVAVGPADRQQVTPGTARRRIRELQLMVPEFVDRTGGSKWLSALPTGSKWLRALPGYSRQMVTPRPRKMRTRTVQP